MLILQKQWFTKATNPSTYRILEMLNVSNSHQSMHEVDRGLFVRSICCLKIEFQKRSHLKPDPESPSSELTKSHRNAKRRSKN